MTYIARWGKDRSFGRVELDQRRELAKGDLFVGRSERGLVLAEVVGAVRDESRGPAETIRLLRRATLHDLKEAQENRRLEEEALRAGRAMVEELGLPMKLVEAEYTLDRGKLFFYFTASQRVDFRQLVKNMARTFRTRIELRQVGARDESAIVGGIGPCGMQCCCNLFLKDFQSIGIRMVRAQNMALNPTKTSGLCGKLLCCMAYELPTYMELWSSLPPGTNPDQKIKTPNGNYVVLGVDVFTNQVRVLHPQGKEIWVDAKDFEEFKRVISSGGSWEKGTERIAAPLEAPSPDEESACKGD